MSDADVMLYRTIRSGKEFDNLIPRSTCKSTYVGEGYTDLSINEMEQLILETTYQTQKLAVALQKQGLKQTCTAIHEFLYNHFSYKSDDSDQMLRSPACSWYQRASGIDCKSYSIAASSLLLNMGITHFIRKIKQPGYEPAEYTHVYVIVPLDQTNGTLLQGYHTIDGTLSTMNEPAFIGKSDLKMSGNKHFTLNAPASLNGVSLSSLKDISKQISIKNIKSIFTSLDCIGGDSLTESGIKTYLGNIENYFQDWQVRFNSAIQNKDYDNVALLDAERVANGYVFYNASVGNKAKKWNSCTTKRIDAAIKAFEFYANVVGQLVDTYLNEYFTRTATTGASYTATNVGMEAKYSFRHLNTDTPVVRTVVSKKLQSKGKTIPAFVVPQYVVDMANLGSPLNLDTFLNLLETAGNVLVPSSGSNSPLPGGSYTQDLPQYNADGTIKAKTATMGAGTVVGGLIVAGGLYYAATQGKSNKAKPKAK